MAVVVRNWRNVAVGVVKVCGRQRGKCVFCVDRSHAYMCAHQTECECASGGKKREPPFAG